MTLGQDEYKDDVIREAHIEAISEKIAMCAVHNCFCGACIEDYKRNNDPQYVPQDYQGHECRFFSDILKMWRG